MKKLLAILLLGTALVAPTAAFAADVTVTATLTNYSGNAAYLAVYVTKPDGSYDSTLWVSGSKQRYLGDLRGWVSALQSAGGTLTLDGITGAIAQNAPLTVRASKIAIREALRDAEVRAMAEVEAAVTACFESADYAEGRRAFMEKRRPVFLGQ